MAVMIIVNPNHETSEIGLTITEGGANYAIYRREYGEEYSYKIQQVIEIDNNGDIAYQLNYIDKTAEPGVYYQYALYTGESLEEDNWTEACKLESDDLYLMTKDTTLRIRYNPSVTSYKRNFAESVTPTLGGIYPITRRNGAQNYRTFQIGGLLSYNIDKESKSFIDNAVIKLLAEQITDAYEKERFLEKQYRKWALEFLHKNQILLFKSYAEGNAFIKLSAIQLASDPKLDRNVYSFTATATEVLPANGANYYKYFNGATSDAISVSTLSITDIDSVEDTVTVEQTLTDVLEVTETIAEY